jgi:HPt (histidine-containing phosphotransfer) domain-containing protein
MTQLVVEKQTLLESLDNDVEFLKTVIGIFLADCPQMMEEIRAAATEHVPTRIMSAAHALKGSVSFFGAKGAVEAARVLESMGRQGNLESLNEALSVLEREMVLVLSALNGIAMEVA